MRTRYPDKNRNTKYRKRTPKPNKKQDSDNRNVIDPSTIKNDNT